MPGLVGTTADWMAGTGRRFKIAAAVIAVVVALLIPISVLGDDEYADSTTAEYVGYLVVGYLCGLSLFAGVPWLVGLTLVNESTQRLHLDGTRLTVAFAGRPRYELDLRSAPPSVELIGGRFLRNITPSHAGPGYRLVFRRQHQVGRGPLQLDRFREYFIPYHPVLVVKREDGDHIPIELCHVATRTMRDPREILALEQVIRLNPDPTAQHAAGQLRTLARWPSLPIINDADRYAVPAAPADLPYGAPPPQTPIRDGETPPWITKQPPQG